MDYLTIKKAGPACWVSVAPAPAQCVDRLPALVDLRGQKLICHRALILPCHLQKPVLGIRGILVLHFSADPDPDPTSGSGSNLRIWLLSSVILRMEKKYFFVLYLTHRHIIFSLKNLIFLKFCVKILFCKRYFSPLNTLWEKGRIREAQKHADPAHLDPQHSQKQLKKRGTSPSIEKKRHKSLDKIF